MGFFKALFSGGGTAFNRLAKSFKEVLDNISQYDISHDKEFLFRAAWILRYGVYNSFEKWSWNMSAKIFIPDYQIYGRITVSTALLLVMEKLNTAKYQLSTNEQTIIDNIMEGEKEYYDVEKLIPLNKKEKLKP